MNKLLFRSIVYFFLILPFLLCGKKLSLPDSSVDLKITTLKRTELGKNVKVKNGTFSFGKSFYKLNIWFKEATFSSPGKAALYFQQDKPQRPLENGIEQKINWSRSRNAVWLHQGSKVTYFIFYLNAKDWDHLSHAEYTAYQAVIAEFLTEILVLRSKSA